MKPCVKIRTAGTNKHAGSIPNSNTNTGPSLVPRPSPEFTVEEAIVLRALAGGKSDKQVCTELRMTSGSFHRLLRDLLEKTGATDHLSLLVWALRQMKSGESRTRHRDSYARLVSEPV